MKVPDDELHRRARALAKALSGAGPSPAKGLFEHFGPVHDALAKRTLPEDAWLELLPHLPSIGFFRDWDRCERLRRAAVMLLDAQGACVSALMRSMDARNIQ